MAEQAAAQASVDASVDVIRKQDTVIASAVSALALIHALWGKAVDQLKAQQPNVDTSVLDQARTEAQAATATLAEAIAANTPASDEVHSDKDGGTGDDSTTVDPTTVDTAPVTDPVTRPDGGGTGGDQG